MVNAFPDDISSKVDFTVQQVCHYAIFEILIVRD